MNIEGNIREAGLGFVSAFFILEKLGIEQLISFLVDTGASRTTISDTDAEIINIEYSSLKKSPKPLVGIGGNCDAYIISNCYLFFKLGNSAHIEYLDYALVSKCPKRPIEQSLLGMDILSRYKIYFLGKKIILEQ